MKYGCAVSGESACRPLLMLLPLPLRSAALPAAPGSHSLMRGGVGEGFPFPSAPPSTSSAPPSPLQRLAKGTETDGEDEDKENRNWL